MKPINHWSMKTALEQLESCGYECEAGNLANNDAWVWLRRAAEVGPEFWPGQGVWCEVSAKVAGQTIKQWRHFYIVGCSMESDTERRYFTYSLSSDPPGPWHYGEVHLRGVNGNSLRLDDPSKTPGDKAPQG